jgi:hypothetical protein
LPSVSRPPFRSAGLAARSDLRAPHHFAGVAIDSPEHAALLSGAEASAQVMIHDRAPEAKMLVKFMIKPRTLGERSLFHKIARKNLG